MPIRSFRRARHKADLDAGRDIPRRVRPDRDTVRLGECFRREAQRRVSGLHLGILAALMHKPALQREGTLIELDRGRHTGGVNNRVAQLHRLSPAWWWAPTRKLQSPS